jgi:lysophospholipase L1-like esterase
MANHRRLRPRGFVWSGARTLGERALGARALGLCALVACSDSASSAPSTSNGTPAGSDGERDPGAMTPSSPSDVSSAETSAEGASDGTAPTRNDGTIDPNIGLEPSADGETSATTSPPVSLSPPSPAADAGSTTPEPTEDPESPAGGPLTVYLAGDSIVQTYTDTPSDRDQAGWGQMLGEYFDDRVTVVNHAIGGRTARRFIDEGRLDAVVAELEPGNFLLVQFGTNDGNRTATYTLGDEVIPYYLDPATDFRTYLQRYVDAAQSRSASIVFVTPTPRNSAYCTGGNGTGAHAAAMRELGQALAIPVVDLNASTVEYLRAICPAPTPEDFFLLRADGSVDGTHFQERGARLLAGFVAAGLSVPGLPFAEYRRAEP